MSFKERVLKIVSKIPKGKTLSYGQVAEIAGSPRAARAVGNIMKENRNPAVPCHRVIKSNGRAGEKNKGGKKKARRALPQGHKIKRPRRRI